MIKKKALVVSRQNGSARAFKAWMQEPKTQESFDIDVFTYQPGQSILNGRLIDSFVTPVSKYDFLISGTSLNAEEDSLFFEWSRQAGITSFAFVDQWINYRERFVRSRLPDQIILIDDRAKNDIIMALNPDCKLLVAGSPALTYLENFWQQHKRKPEKNLIYFATEPATEDYRSAHGISDLEQLEHLITALKKHPDFELRLLPHPSDSLERLQKFSHLIDKTSKANIFERSALIAGMRSMILLESSMLGIPTLSLQIGRKTTSSLTDNRFGIKVATQFSEIDFSFGDHRPDYSLSKNSWTEKILKFI